MVAGGFDDFSEEGSFEFANMKATSNAETEFAMGREPNEFSRPMTTTRAGVSLLSPGPESFADVRSSWKARVVVSTF